MASEEQPVHDEEVLDYGEGNPEDMGAEVMDSEAPQPEPMEQETLIKEEHPSEEKEGDGSGDSVKVEDPTDDAEDPTKLPPHGTEVFISRVPKEATDEQIRAFCETAGEVHSLRVPRDPGNAGISKGYAFVVFRSKEGATQAVSKLNQSELPDFTDRKVSVVMSQVKNRLFLGNIPRDMNKDTLQTLLSAAVKGIENVELMIERETLQNRGFGFIEFYNHVCAETARKVLSKPEFRLQDRTVTVTWAEPKRLEQEAERVKAIYVGNLPANVDNDKLKSIFGAYGEIETISIPRSKEDPSKFRDYGFIHYKERSSALRAIEETESTPPTLDDQQLMVHMAKPQMHHDQRPPFSSSSYGREGGFNDYRSGGNYSRPPGGFSGRPDMGGRGGRPMPPPGRPPYRAPAMEEYGGYEDYGGYGEEEMEGYGDGYDAYGYGAYGGAGGGTMMVPMMLPNGQIAYTLAGGMAGMQRPTAGYGMSPGGVRGVYGMASPGMGGRGGPPRGPPPPRSPYGSGGGGYGGSPSGRGGYGSRGPSSGSSRYQPYPSR